MKHSVKLSLIVLAAAQPAIAEDIPWYRADEVVVTASRFKEPQAANPTNVTVVTREDIGRSTAKTLPELLSTQAGIHTRSTDGTQDMAIDLRGFGVTGNQNTVVLLDGQRLNDLDLSSVKWSAIPLASIEKIEIIRGGGAVLYGGGATGGTINIITRKPGKGTAANLALALGSYDTRDWQGWFSAGGESAGMRVTGGNYKSDGYRENNRNEQQNLEADVRYAGDSGDLAVKFGADRQDLRYPGVRRVNPGLGINQLETDPRGTATPLDYGKRDGGHVALVGERNFNWGELAGELSYRDKKQQAFFAASGGSYLDTDLNTQAFAPRLKIPHTIFGPASTLVVGADLADWDYDSRRSASAATIGTPTAHILATQRNQAFYVQNTTQASSATTVALGARVQHVDYHARDRVNTAAYADVSQSRTARAFELGARHRLNGSTALFGKIGRSFRIATVDEIYDQFGGPAFDSIIRMLEPQTSNDRELGIDWQSGKTSVRATAYHMDLNNEIHYNALTFTNMNLSPTRRYGLELEGRQAIGETLNVRVNYTLAVAQFREGVYGGTNVTGNNIPLVPRHTFNLTGSWSIGAKTVLSAAATHVGDQYFDNDQSNSFGQKIPAYTVADLKLAHREGGWTLTAAVNNLFNEKYYTYGIRSTFTPGVYNAYPMPERNFTVSAGYTF